MSSPARSAGLRAARCALTALAAAFGAGCDAPHSAPAPAPVARSAAERIAPGVEDLERIRWHRHLRVLFPRAGGPDGRAPLDTHAARLIERFAEGHFLETVWVPVERWSDLLPALLAGEGHVVAAGLNVSAARKRRVAFTVPVETARLQLVTRRGDRIDGPHDLAGREVAVRAHSAAWSRVQASRRARPEIGVRVLDEDRPVDDVLAAIAAGSLDMAVVDAGGDDALLARWPDLRAQDPLVDDDPRAFAVHPSSVELLDALNTFIRQEKLAEIGRDRYRVDLPGIEKRGVLRMLTRHGPAVYFIWRGELLGFEYELLDRFAASRGLHLEVVVPATHEGLLPMLREGGGDIVAAALPWPDGVEGGPEDVLATTYLRADVVVVGRRDEALLESPIALAGRRIAARPDGGHWRLLERLVEITGIDLELVPVAGDMGTEEIAARVADGQFDLAVMSAHELEIELHWRDDVHAALTLRARTPHAWLVRDDAPRLHAALEAFMDATYRGLEHNVAYERYFENPRRTARIRREESDSGDDGSLSPYDEVVRRFADRYGFDWALLVAQMHQESRFDPNARSFAGALGLMQVLPATAVRFGIRDLHDVERGIEAGVRYMAWLHEQFEDELDVRDRLWFTLAAYNAGLGHVYDARDLAERLGSSPDRWFGHVDRAMLLLREREYYRDAVHGFARGDQTVNYVREIRDRYNAYAQLVGEAGTAASRN